MLKPFLALAAALSLAGWQGTAQAEEADIPLAVTDTAHPSLEKTPTKDELKKSDQYLESGLLFLKEQKYRRAVNEFQDSVRLAPRAANFKALGTAYYYDGNKAKAAWAYRESLQLKQDPKVQELIDSLEGKDHPEDGFGTKYDELRFARLLKSAAKAEKSGKRDTALRDYLDAYGVMQDAGARGPALRLSAELATEYLAARSLARAARILIKAQNVITNAKDLGAQEMENVKKIEAAEDRLAEATGSKLREHEKDMQSDKDRWERQMEEISARKGGGGRIKLEVDNR